MSSSKNAELPNAEQDPDDEEFLSPLEDWPPEDRLVSGLQHRQMGAPLQEFQAGLVEAFDRADLAGKARMLGPYWRNWRHHFER